MTHKLNSDNTVAVATEVYWEDIATCPRGAKVQLLTIGGVAIYGNYKGEAFYTAWAPVPRKRVEGKKLSGWVLTSPTGKVFKGVTKYDCVRAEASEHHLAYKVQPDTAATCPRCGAPMREEQALVQTLNPSDYLDGQAVTTELERPQRPIKFYECISCGFSSAKE